MHYYKRHIGDYAKKTGRLTMLEHGAYTLLIDACYDRERFPTRDEAIEWAWARTPQEIEAVDFVLSRFFDLVDGLYVQKRIQEEVDGYHGNSATNKRIAIEREEKRRQRARSVNETSPDVDEAPPNHEPITKNHEPVKEANASLSATRLPDCPHKEILNLFAKHLPHLTQPRLWEGTRAQNLRARWLQCSKPSSFNENGYTSLEDGLKFWDSFFAYIAKDTKLSNGFESNGRSWKPDLPWILNATNFAKIIDGKYDV